MPFFVWAQKGKNVFDFKLKDGSAIQITVCTERIFRIRFSGEGHFPETLMERYGIINTGWPDVEAQFKSDKIQTSACKIIVDKRAGELKMVGSNGKTIIDQIRFFDGNSRLGTELSGSLKSYFGDEKPVNNIIGDTVSSEKGVKRYTDGSLLKSHVLSLSLKEGERFYGGGSTSRKTIQHRGEALRMWTIYQKSEIPVPFLISSGGWGIYNNITQKNYFDIGRFQNDKLYIYNTCNYQDFYLIAGNTMMDVLKEYTSITGRAYLLPQWAYGLAFGGNMMEDQFDVMNDAVRFRDEKIPCDLFWLEPQWMENYYDASTTKNWNYDKFPGEPSWQKNNFPKYEAKTLFIHKLHGLGFKLALWLNVRHDLSIEEEDLLADKYGNEKSGTEPWFSHLTRFMDQGVDGFKLDPSRTIDEFPDRKYYNGYTDKEMHNLNQVLLPKQMCRVFREHKGIRSFHHYCGGYAGTQHWGASTCGDNGGGRVALLDQLNLGLSGFVNTSMDILEGVPDNKQGMHFGFFLPWVQLNSWYNLLHPWYMPPDEKETFRYYSQLRHDLFPYIYSTALEGSLKGLPIVRAMPLMFPGDRNVDNMTNEYMFGENLLVSIFSDSIYLPEGSWINYWTGEKVSGSKTIHSEIPPNRGGLLFIRDGAIIPYQKKMQYIGELSSDTLLLKVYPSGKSEYTLYEDDGQTFSYKKGKYATTEFSCNSTGQQIELTISKRRGRYDNMTEHRVWEVEVYTDKPTPFIINGRKYKLEEIDYSSEKKCSHITIRTDPDGAL